MPSTFEENSMTEIKLPPQNIIAEKSVLGGVMLDGRKLDAIAEAIKPSDFYSEINGKIFKACLDLRKGGAEVDTITLGSHLESTGQLGEIGGGHYLIELFEAVPHGAHIGYHAALIKDCSLRRSLMMIGRELSEKASDMSIDRNELLESILSSTLKLGEHMTRGKVGARTLSEHIDGVIETLASGKTPTVWWMIPAIDAITGGLSLGELVLLAARPSHGKSMVALQCIECAASKGIPCLIISEEMSAESLATRSLTSLSCIPNKEWSQSIDRLKFDKREKFEGMAPILIEEKCGTIAACERAIARAVQSNDVKLVAVDYAQIVTGDGDNKAQQVGDVSSRLKACAMRHNIIVLLLAQLNRGIESRENPHPGLADLKDSGGLEQDADVALFPFWPKQIDAEYEHPNEYRIYQRKNRNRGIGTAVLEMRIIPERQRIEAISGSDDDWHDRAESQFTT